MMGLIERILFIDNPDALTLSQEIITTCQLLILPAFIIGMSCEYFSGMNFQKVIGKLVIAIFALQFFIPLHTQAVKMSFDYSGDLLSKFGENNKFTDKYEKVAKESGEDGFFYQILFKITGFTNLASGIILNFISFICLFFIKYIYSIIYYLTMILVGVSAVISFLPISESSMSGHFKASLWCILMPVVVTFILILVGNSDVISFSDSTATSGLVGHSIKFISLRLMSLCILLCPIITMKLIDGSGIHAAASTIAKTAVFTTITKATGGLGGMSSAQTQLASNASPLPPVRDVFKPSKSSHTDIIMGKNGGSYDL